MITVTIFSFRFSLQKLLQHSMYMVVQIKLVVVVVLGI